MSEPMGWRRILVLTAFATAFGILMDRMGVINAVARRIP